MVSIPAQTTFFCGPMLFSLSTTKIALLEDIDLDTKTTYVLYTG